MGVAAAICILPGCLALAESRRDQEWKARQAAGFVLFAVNVCPAACTISIWITKLLPGGSQVSSPLLVWGATSLFGQVPGNDGPRLDALQLRYDLDTAWEPCVMPRN